jgi:hypothetical protein
MISFSCFYPRFLLGSVFFCFSQNQANSMHQQLSSTKQKTLNNLLSLCFKSSTMSPPTSTKSSLAKPKATSPSAAPLPTPLLKFLALILMCLNKWSPNTHSISSPSATSTIWPARSSLWPIKLPMFCNSNKKQKNKKKIILFWILCIFSLISRSRFVFSKTKF